MTVRLTAGQLCFRPGQDLPAISSTRKALAGVLLRGKPTQNAAQQLPRLYTLCGEAHRLTAQLAIDAACGERVQARAQEIASLVIETAREHVRRIWIDWPRLMRPSVLSVHQAEDADSMQALRDCPLFGQSVSSIRQ